jgi:hypothetical protein
MTRRSIWAAGAVVAAVVLLVIVLVLNPFSSAPAGSGTSGALFGAFVQPGPRTGADRRAAVTSFESLIGRPLAMERVYYRWDEPWPTADDDWTRDAGRIPFISWNTRLANGSWVPWTDIAAGRYDDVLHERAAALKAFGSPVVFSFNHEPENDPAAGSADDFVSAYQHIHDVFETDGVTNVTYAWTMMAWSFRSGNAAAYYPGDDVVDVVAADGYNQYGCPQGNAPWRSFTDIFNAFYSFGAEHGKRMVVAEWGAHEDPADPGREASWFDEASAQLQQWPGIVAVLYFDADRGCARWVDSSPQTLDAFRAMASNPYFDAPTTVVTSPG